MFSGDEQMLVEVLDKVQERSGQCIREILGHSDDGLVGFAMVAPDCIVMAYSVSPMPIVGGFHDFCLN